MQHSFNERPVELQASTCPRYADYAYLKQRQQATWASGDFAVIGITLQIVGESLAEARTFAPVSACSMSRPATAMQHWLQPAALRSHLHRLRADAARQRPRARAAEGLQVNSGWPTPNTCRSRMAASTPCCRRSARCSLRSTRGPRARCCAWSATVAASGWRTGRPKALSDSCSRSSAVTFPRPRA